ncbi:hypothetical protein TeGR_g10649 [Tetraparma gracilis]|uniref:CHORD domain-containing protein n=1 Tax=Tetraparma gracilis TaxID=2962635 RepID=A0ABQ6NC40_9STRA|nr:hypothetical protein TeGR_g10649 [Tetraparma gracilis]
MFAAAGVSKIARFSALNASQKQQVAKSVAERARVSAASASSKATASASSKATASASSQATASASSKATASASSKATASASSEAAASASSEAAASASSEASSRRGDRDGQSERRLHKDYRNHNDSLARSYHRDKSRSEMGASERGASERGASERTPPAASTTFRDHSRESGELSPLTRQPSDPPPPPPPPSAVPASRFADNPLSRLADAAPSPPASLKRAASGEVAKDSKRSRDSDSEVARVVAENHATSLQILQFAGLASIAYFDPATPPACRHHKSPPVFHETAKWWSCCPHKKAYDWEGFQTIPGCEEGTCSNVKEAGAAGSGEFMGGCELRGDTGGGAELQDINSFNSQEGAKKKLAGIKEAFAESWCDLDEASWDQMVEGMKGAIEKEGPGAGGGGSVEERILKKLGAEIKKSMKAVIVEQMRL